MDRTPAYRAEHSHQLNRTCQKRDLIHLRPIHRQSSRRNEETSDNKLADRPRYRRRPHPVVLGDQDLLERGAFRPRAYI